MSALRKGGISRGWGQILSAVLFYSYLFITDGSLRGFEPGVELGWNDEDMILFFGAHKPQFQELRDKVAGQQQLLRVDKYMAVVVPHSPVKIEPQFLSDLRQRMRELQLDGAIRRESETGADLGPDLTAFGKQQPAEVLINAIVNPSAEISHGFEGSEVQTKDGLTITGIVLSDGDPLIIKSVGGLLQTVPRERIAAVKKMDKSLMYPPALLGLTPQAIADIVAYLRQM